jgi:NMD protein affecting ribosome stability and mRNA decay
MPKRLHDTPAARNTAQWTPRRDSVEEGFGHDPYEARHHLPEPSACPVCEAVFHAGRWTWMDEPPADAHEELCPACRRARDQYPAGFLRLDGPFAREHSEDLLRLAQSEATVETAEHPLNRIMDIQEDPDGIMITTTDVHLPQRIGEAISRAFHGELDIQYAEEDHLVRARWTR